MQFRHIQIPADKAFLCPVGDIHWGDKAFKREGLKKLQGYLDWATENRDVTRILLMGDIYNVAGRNEKTSPFESDPEEFDEVSTFFEPYKDIIVGAIDGNHELRMTKSYGFNPLKSVLCKNLNIPYFGTDVVLRLQVGKRADSESYWQNYYCFAHHTTGGGGTIGNALNTVQKLERIVPGCDVYMGGHNHQLAEGAQCRYRPTYSGVEKTKVHYVSCGSYLGYPDSYAEASMMSPGKLGSPRIRFNGERDRHDVHVSI
jgi:hypothetical protein